MNTPTQISRNERPVMTHRNHDDCNALYIFSSRIDSMMISAKIIVSRRQNKFGLPKPLFPNRSVFCSFLKRKGAAGQELLIYLRTTIIFSASSNQIESLLFDIGPIRLSRCSCSSISFWCIKNAISTHWGVRRQGPNVAENGRFFFKTGFRRQWTFWQGAKLTLFIPALCTNSEHANWKN